MKKCFLAFLLLTSISSVFAEEEIYYDDGNPTYGVVACYS